MLYTLQNITNKGCKSLYIKRTLAQALSAKMPALCSSDDAMRQRNRDISDRYCMRVHVVCNSNIKGLKLIQDASQLEAYQDHV
jgi:hypothetical protein